MSDYMLLSLLCRQKDSAKDSYKLCEMVKLLPSLSFILHPLSEISNKIIMENI
jgi:hypothetical protein